MRSRPHGRAARRIGLGAFVAGAALWLSVQLGVTLAHAADLTVGSLGIAFALIAAHTAWCASRRPSPDATAWLLLAASLGVCSLYAVTSVAVEAFGLTGGWPTAAGLLGLLFRLIMALAIVSFPLMASTARSRWRARLDLVLVGTTIAFLAWAWVLSDLFHHAVPSTPAARAALFALLDVVLVIIVLMVSLRRPAGVRDATRLLGIGLVFLAITDGSISTFQASGATGTAPFAVVTSFIALAFITGGAWLAAHPVSDDLRPAPRRRARDLLPIGLAALAFATAVTSGHPWDDPVLMGLAIASVTSLLAWQVAMVLEGEEMVDTLSEQSQRFSTLVDTAPIAIIETDRDGVIEIINSEAARILDRDAATLIGRRLDLETVSGEDVGLRERVLGGETIRDARISMIRRDGVTMDLLVSSAGIANRSGEVSGVVWTGSDDGPRLRGFAAMIAVQRMEAYEQLTSGIAHDFNNRLAVILGTTEILRDSATDREQREMLDAVLSSGRRAAALVDRLVGTTRRKSDDQEHLDLAALLTRLEPDLARLSAPGTTVHVDIGDDPLPVEADESDLRQAITNLVVNAMEATSDGGTISVRAGLKPAAPGSGPALIELVVTDDGSGMDAATEARIFEPFFTTRTGGGRSRGLGLPAVQGVVLRSRGEIDVQTTAGGGTTVTVRLPRREHTLEARPTEGRGPEVPVLRTGATILLVDDEPEVRTITGRVLTDAGYTVISAGDAAEALSVVVAGDVPIDVLVTDVVMPGRSGIDLAHDITTRHPGLPVLLLSGFVGESAHGGLPADLPFPLLSKPTPRAALLEAIADLIPVPA